MCSRCPTTAAGGTTSAMDIDRSCSGALGLESLIGSAAQSAGRYFSPITTSNSNKVLALDQQQQQHQLQHQLQQHLNSNSSGSYNSGSYSYAGSNGRLSSRKSATTNKTNLGTNVTNSSDGCDVSITSAAVFSSNNSHQYRPQGSSQHFGRYESNSSCSTPSKLLSNNSNPLSLLVPDLISQDVTNFINVGHSNSSATAICNWKDFLDSALNPSSPSTTLFSSPFPSHLTTQMLGVPTPPQSNPTPITPSTHHINTHHFMNNLYTLPSNSIFNLVC